MKPVLKYPGAKNRIAKWICNYIPEHKVYLEPYAGSLAVLFEKERSQRAFAVYNLVVGDRQNEIFGKSIDHRKSDRVVVVLSENGIGLDIPERIVHPAHVPFEVEPKPAHIHGSGNTAPCRRLLGYHERFGEL